jgi:uncharacterized protein (UPF0332 family)
MNKKDLKWYMEKKVIIKTDKISRLTDNFLEKARKNLITASILFQIEKEKEVRKLLRIPEDYSSNEWVVIAAYYAMYMASLAGLAKLGLKSKSHDATILALEEFFVKKGLLENEVLEMIKDAKLEVEYIKMIRIAKDRREIAQYSPTKQTTRFLAEKTMENAFKFVERIEDLISHLAI